MDIFQLLLLGLCGVLGGMLAGVFGVGGGGVFVPALVYVAGWEIKEAVAASLVVMFFSALSGAIRSMRSAAPADPRTAALFSLVVAPSSLIGVAVSRFSPDTLVQIVFAVFLLALAYPTFRSGAESGGKARFQMPPVLALLGGVAVGALAGLVGIGGAALMVPLMVFGFGLSHRTAISTSLIVTLFVAMIGSAGYIATGFDELSGLPPLIAGSMAGAWIGVRIRDRLSDIVLKRAFAAFMTVVALRVLTDAANVL